MHSLVHQDRLENIKIGKVLQLKLIKVKFVLLRLFLLKELQQQLKEINQRLFVTFRPSEDIKDEVSITSGHDYKSSTVTASSGKKKIFFLFTKKFCMVA